MTPRRVKAAGLEDHYGPGIRRLSEPRAPWEMPTAQTMAPWARNVTVHRKGIVRKHPAQKAGEPLRLQRPQVPRPLAENTVEVGADPDPAPAAEDTTEDVMISDRGGSRSLTVRAQWMISTLGCGRSKLS